MNRQNRTRERNLEGVRNRQRETDKKEKDRQRKKQTERRIVRKMVEVLRE